MTEPQRPSEASWFRSRGGRRFGVEFGAIIVLKLVALVLIWFFCIRPQPRADTQPAAVAEHMLGPAVHEATDDR